MPEPRRGERWNPRQPVTRSARLRPSDRMKPTPQALEVLLLKKHHGCKSCTTVVLGPHPLPTPPSGPPP
eukprot:9167234-Prorocentrum_lima.AAC.1